MPNNINVIKLQTTNFKGVKQKEETSSNSDKKTMKTSVKVAIGTGVAALAAVGIYIATKGKTKIKPDSKLTEEATKNIDHLFDEGYEIYRVNDGLRQSMQAKLNFVNGLGSDSEFAPKLFFTDLSKKPENSFEVYKYGSFIQNSTQTYAPKANMISFKDGEIIFNGKADRTKEEQKYIYTEEKGYTIDTVNSFLKYENKRRNELLTSWGKPQYSVADALYETTSSKEFNELIDKLHDLPDLKRRKNIPEEIIELHNTVKGMFKAQLEKRGFDMEDVCRRYSEYRGYNKTN